jgi:hypothetical protein
MPKDVIYTQKSDAQKYADETNGVVLPVDSDEDGALDGWVVENYEGSTRGPMAEELAPLNGSFKPAAEVEKYLEDLEAAGSPKGKNMGGVVVDELGYMNGGATYTKRGPIKYSKGGAVRGKTFSGSY